MLKLKKNQKGLAAIEMTLVLPILLLLLFATVEFSRLLYQYNALTKVVRNATRYILANPSFDSSNEGDVSSEIRNAAEYLLIYGDLGNTTPLLPNLAATTLAASTLNIDVSGQFITVTASYDWQPIFGDILPSFVSGSSFDLRFPLVTTYTMRAL